MTGAAESVQGHADAQENAEEMDRYGITRVPVDRFHFREFKYSNLKDAIAEAKRQEARDPE